MSLFKVGIDFSDLVAIMREEYAQVTFTPDSDYGFDRVAGARRDRLLSILSGIDTDVWDSSRVSLIPTVTSADASTKRSSKRIVNFCISLYPS